MLITFDRILSIALKHVLSLNLSPMGHVHFALIRLQRLTKFIFAFAPFSFCKNYHRVACCFVSVLLVNVM